MAQQTRLSSSWFPPTARCIGPVEAHTPTARRMQYTSRSGQPFFLAPVDGLANISEVMLSYQAMLSA